MPPSNSPCLSSSDVLGREKKINERNFRRLRRPMEKTVKNPTVLKTKREQFGFMGSARVKHRTLNQKGFYSQRRRTSQLKKDHKKTIDLSQILQGQTTNVLWTDKTKVCICPTPLLQAIIIIIIIIFLASQ